MGFHPSWVTQQLKGSYKTGGRIPSRPKTIAPKKQITVGVEIRQVCASSTGKRTSWKCVVKTEYGTYVGFESQDYYECWNWSNG